MRVLRGNETERPARCRVCLRAAAVMVVVRMVETGVAAWGGEEGGFVAAVGERNGEYREDLNAHAGCTSSWERQGEEERCRRERVNGERWPVLRGGSCWITGEVQTEGCAYQGYRGSSLIGNRPPRPRTTV